MIGVAMVVEVARMASVVVDRSADDRKGDGEETVMVELGISKTVVMDAAGFEVKRSMGEAVMVTRTSCVGRSGASNGGILSGTGSPSFSGTTAEAVGKDLAATGITE